MMMMMIIIIKPAVHTHHIYFEISHQLFADRQQHTLAYSQNRVKLKTSETTEEGSLSLSAALTHPSPSANFNLILLFTSKMRWTPKEPRIDGSVLGGPKINMGIRGREGVVK